jgi:hypothetical protein
MKISIQMLSVGSTELFFLFDKAHHPAIEMKGTHYTSLSHLLQNLPSLADPQHIEKLAQIANFLAKGIEFQYIENLDLFKENYYQQIEAEQLDVLNEGPKLKDYGAFDLSVMHSPRFMDQKLVFFVKHDYLSIPYRVSLFYPIDQEPLRMSYELLPVL